MSRFREMLRTIILSLGAFWLVAATGCSKPKVDLQKYRTNRIQSALDKYEKHDAIEYFESGGKYVDMGFDDEAPFDKPFVLPLLKLLESKYHYDFFVLVPAKKKGDEFQVARELVAANSPGIREEEVDEVIRNYDETMPGETLFEWSTDWVALDFFTPEDLEELDAAEERFRLEDTSAALP